jgi:hypothetical protein
MIRPDFIIGTISGLVAGMALDVIGFAVLRAIELRAKDTFVERFATATIAVFEDDGVPEKIKQMFADLAPHIESRWLALKLISDRRKTINTEFDLIGLPSAGREKVYRASFFFLMALSYSAEFKGRHLRRQLTGDVGNPASTIRSASRAYRVADAVHV